MPKRGIYTRAISSPTRADSGCTGGSPLLRLRDRERAAGVGLRPGDLLARLFLHMRGFHARPPLHPCDVQAADRGEGEQDLGDDRDDRPRDAAARRERGLLAVFMIPLVYLPVGVRDYSSTRAYCSGCSGSGVLANSGALRP